MDISEAVLIPLVCPALHMFADTNAKIAALEERLSSADTRGIMQSAPLPPNPAQDNQALAELQSAVRDLASRVTATATASVPAPPSQARAPQRAPAPPSNQPPQRPSVLPMVPSARAPAPPAQSSAVSTGFDWDIPRGDVETGVWYGDPKAYAAKSPHSWEAEQYRQGKYDLSQFRPGKEDPDYARSLPKPSLPSPPSPPTYANAAATKPAQGKGKRKGKAPATAAQVAASSGQGPSRKGPSPLPIASRRFFAPRTLPLPHASAMDIVARAPDIAAHVLREMGCPYSLSFTASLNSRGVVTLVANDAHTSATAYAPYYEAISHKLNQSFPVGDHPFLHFRPAPNDVQLVIHQLPTDYLPAEQADLTEALTPSILNAVEVRIFSASFLQPNPDLRRAATSVVISVAPQDAPRFFPSIKLFSQNRKVEHANSANRFTQCRRCWRFGHAAKVCKAPSAVCPLCSGLHSRSAHRCVNPTCPKGGNSKAVPACCAASPLLCNNCNGPHTATDPSCPTRPRPSSPPSDDGVPLGNREEMDTDPQLPPALPSRPVTPQRRTEEAPEAPTPKAPQGGLSAPPPHFTPIPRPAGAFFSQLARGFPDTSSDPITK